MADSKALKRIVGGTLVAALVLASIGDGDAHAARKKKRRKRGRSLTVQRINVAGSANVAGNQVIEVTFNSDVDPSTVNHAFFQVRGANATQTGFTKQVFGSFQIVGNTVRFFPRLPTHLRDPSSPTGGFYPAGSTKDNAVENAGLQANTGYEIRLMGGDSFSPMRNTRGRALARTVTAQFSTASANDPATFYTTASYEDSPPPQFAFSNPPDRVPTPADQYTRIGGASDVPNDIAVSLFCTKVPLSPTTARLVGNVELTQTERAGNPDVRRPINGDVFIEQNFATTLLVYQPKFPLTDRSTYALRLKKSVKDLTEQYDFSSNRDRERLRAIYDWLANARADNPGTPAGELTDPPAALIPDWPNDPAERGVLKENMLTLGDSRPDEIDPRVIVLFTTRDEPISDAALTINFLRDEDLYDARLSTAEWDQSVPGAASAIMTIAAGDGSDGDFTPDADITIDTDQYPGNHVSWRNVLIPAGVVVTLKGSRPITIQALSIQIDGEMYADGERGDNGTGGNSYLNTPRTDTDGGLGGPGGGVGGDAASKFASAADAQRGKGLEGTPGHDVDLVEAAPEDGGRGGKGGLGASNSSAYHNAGGGGGGGARLAGGAGANSNSSNGWNAKGGAGGEGSDNEDLDPLVGGAGGASGGNGAYASQGWGVMAGAGGGGGGAINVQTAGVMTMGIDAVLGARGGGGGNPKNYSAMSGGPGGGGGGGSLKLQSSAGFDFASPTTNLDVNGGPGGTQSSGSYSRATSGGVGGLGYIRIEDPSGGEVIPGLSTGGTYDPVGGGVPSILYSKFADLGVQDPRVLNPTNDDTATNPTNDAIFVEVQMTRENPSLFGEPDFSAIDNATQETTDETVTSRWMPYKVHDNTGIPGGAFSIPDYNPSVQGSEYSFPIDSLNGKGYRFVRIRITFQLDDLQSRSDPIPFVDFLTIHFQFNF